MTQARRVPWTPGLDDLRTIPDAELACAFARPRLIVIVDTEEEFDWTQPLSRGNVEVSHIPSQARAQSIFSKYGVVPTYVVDYPVATHPAASGFLRNLVTAGHAEIGAHLHPWVNPPHEEPVEPATSYAGNLPSALERAKLSVLVETIESRLGIRPQVYKAGRYGFGPNTLTTIQELGFSVDCSMVAYTSFSDDGGPDYRRVSHRPAWLGDYGDILELPLTAGFVGGARRWGSGLFPYVSGPRGLRLHIPGVLARSRLLERIRLSPEGASLWDLRRLTDMLIQDGCRVFCLAYHSPSLEPGHTPYVRSTEDLQNFLATLDRFLDYFTTTLGGVPATPEELRNALKNRTFSRAHSLRA